MGDWDNNRWMIEARADEIKRDEVNDKAAIGRLLDENDLLLLEYKNDNLEARRKSAVGQLPGIYAKYIEQLKSLHGLTAKQHNFVVNEIHVIYRDLRNWPQSAATIDQLYRDEYALIDEISRLYTGGMMDKFRPATKSAAKKGPM